jgi:septum formation protein
MSACQSIRYVLGSRSPRRLELLRLIVPAEQIDVVPPVSSEEPDFDDLTTWDAIRDRLTEITRGKSEQVCRQLTPPQRKQSIVITADTVIVVSQEPRGRSPSASESLQVLGQPPDDETVRAWFWEYYAGRPHIAATALRVVFPAGTMVERVVTTTVAFRADIEPFLDWYIATGEPRGKAGGYALQGAGSVFVERVEGSVSNVVGLPLEALMEIMASVEA